MYCPAAGVCVCARACTSRGRHTRAVVSRVERREYEPRERFVSDARGRESSRGTLERATVEAEIANEEEDENENDDENDE